jgi:hypothetical protein
VSRRTSARSLGLAIVVALFAGASEAHAAETCNPNGADPARFCVTDTLTVTPTTAAAPPELVLAVQNTSPTLDSTATWINTATFNLTDPSVAAQPSVTRSSQLANGLLLTPPGACTVGASYTDCGGGHGDLVAISDGGTTTTGSFGISKIVNVNPPGAGIYARYDLTIKGCVLVPFAGCSSTPDTVQQLIIGEPPSGSAARLTFALATRFSVPGLQYSMTKLLIDLKGASDQLDGGGSTGQAQTAFALPPTCGSIAGSTSFTSTNGRSVSVPHSIAVAGCPPPADPVTPPADPVTPPVDPDPDPTAPPGPPAQPTASTVAVSGEANRKKISADGQVAPAPSGGQLQVELLRKKGHEFVSVKSASVALASGAFATTFKNPKHTRKCELTATFGGDSALLPSEATDKFRC